MRNLVPLVTIVVLCFSSALLGQDWSALDGFDRAKLEGSWIVEAVEIDGSLTNAQIGQKPGDVISVSGDVNVGLPKVG